MGLSLACYSQCHEWALGWYSHQVSTNLKVGVVTSPLKRKKIRSKKMTHFFLRTRTKEWTQICPTPMSEVFQSRDSLSSLANLCLKFPSVVMGQGEGGENGPEMRYEQTETEWVIVETGWWAFGCTRNYFFFSCRSEISHNTKGETNFRILYTHHMTSLSWNIQETCIIECQSYFTQACKE